MQTSSFGSRVWGGALFAGDVGGVTASPTSDLVCTEAGKRAVFSLLLTSEPTSLVTVGVNSDDTTEGSLGNVSTITFTSQSWSTAQTVTVTGADDDVVDGNISFSVIIEAATSSDTNYHGVDGQNINVTTSDGKSILLALVFRPSSWWCLFRRFCRSSYQLNEWLSVHRGRRHGSVFVGVE